MPRSPLITRAVNDLAKYYQAITDAEFIDRSWSIATAVNEERKTLAGKTTTDNVNSRIEASQKILGRADVGATTGLTFSGQIADLINGAVGIGSFIESVTPEALGDRSKEFEFHGFDQGFSKFLSLPFSAFKYQQKSGVSSSKPDTLIDPVSNTHPNVNMYSINVRNPFLGPVTKDVGAVEIFMNALPTLELSKCVPYINLELITLRRTVGTVAPSLTLIGFLNPPALGSADKAMLGAQTERVKSEVLDLGDGIRSGIELFTAPQTLVNMGLTGPEFVPAIDRFRPLASLGNLSLSTKLQGGTLSFTTGRLELTIHDRSRLRDLAAFVKPDLYGTTFLDITYGWSHPEGGISSPNSYGKFLDALKTQTRYRISNSTYTFEEGGSVKVTLSIQSVGSIDLLYLGPRNTSPAMRSVESLCRAVNERLAEMRLNGTAPAPSMAQYDIIDTIKDPTSLLRAASDKDEIKKLAKLISSGKIDPDIKANLTKLLGNINSSSTEVSAGATDTLRNELASGYESVLASIPNFSNDSLSSQFCLDNDGFRIKALSDNTVVLTGESKASPTTPQTKTITANFDADTKFGSMDEYVSFGSAFMKMIADPVRASGQYDEVQVIFYPFNKYAGAVHDLPISCFPMERGRFAEAIKKAAKETPELSCRAIIRLMQDRFIGFPPARAYLMAGFYNQGKASEGTVELEDRNQVDKVWVGGEKVAVSLNFQYTLEQRLAKVGIPEMTMKMPQVEVAVEASKMLDTNGNPIVDDLGNTKTILKMHVYDAAMDPHGTFTEIMSSVKENELGMIQVPVADFNAGVKGGLSARDAAGNSKVADFIKAGLDAGVLEAVGLASQEIVTSSSGKQNIDDLVKDVTEGTVLIRVKGSFEEIKRLVSTGMPTLTYGSSTSAITSANLTTGGGAGLANVMLQRTFASPGEVAAENINTGVPMQILPAQLSLSTLGCPLFSPMQRFFIDFGTGTSLDSVYFVTSVDTTIGKDGYKTDLKMSYGQGFATYVSVNKQLAMMTANFAAADPTASGTQPVTPPASTPKPPPTEAKRRADAQRVVDAYKETAQRLTADQLWEFESAKKFLESTATAAVEEGKKKAEKTLTAATPTKVTAAAADGTAASEKAKAGADAAAAKKAKADALAKEKERISQMSNEELGESLP